MNLEKQILKEHSVKNAELISDYIESNPEILFELLKIVLEGDKLLSQRSAWVLGKFSNEFYFELIIHIDYIISEVKNAKHVAVSRNFARVFMILTDKNYIQYLSDKQIDSIVEISFGWLISGKEKAAVVAFSMYTLMNLLKIRNWIVPELEIYIVNNMPGSLPSFQAAGKKVIKAIKLFRKVK